MRIPLVRWLIVLLVCLAALGSARADERILDFFSDIAVARNGDLIVSERVRVMAEGDQISRGILRDFPTRYRRPDGTAVVVGFDVLDVRRDGQSEPYALETLANGVRIRIGSGDVFLEPGPYEYEIRYKTTRQIGFFDQYDELYWNVTGTGWTFPIDRAGARITLPASVPILQTAVYTGPQGAASRNARLSDQQPGVVAFETTAPLGVGEGLTVAAAWPKGLVTPPTTAQIWIFALRDNLAAGVAMLGFVVLCGYYVHAHRVRRRRSLPAIVPRYEPPEGLSAPSVRYIVRQKFDNRAYVVGMLQLIASRAMVMRKTDTGTEFEKRGTVARDNPRDGMLAAMFKRLFPKDSPLRTDGENSVRLHNARRALETRLANRWDKALFQSSGPWAGRGLRLWLIYTAVCVAALWWQGAPASSLMIIGVVCTAIGLGACAACVLAWRRRGFSIGYVLLLVVFVAPFLVSGLSALVGAGSREGWSVLAAILPGVSLLIVIAAFSTLRGYTATGYRLLDEINGFKQYLTLAEGPRLQALVTPTDRLAVYEKCLPYAVALDVGKEWSAQFAGLFAGVAAGAAVQAMQQHYAGHDLLRSDPSDLVAAVTRDFTPVHTPSSSSAPGSSSSWSSGSSSSSSSGSSGGGSSGGGGGGGGGSGW